MVPKVGDNCPLYDSCEINWIINTLQNKNTTETIETISLVLFVFHPTSLYLYCTSCCIMRSYNIKRS